MFVDGIHEMEHLREQIRSMLHSGGKTGFSPDFMNLSSTSSIDTIALLKNALPQSSPEMQLDENGILLSSLSSNMFLGKPSSTRQTSPMLLDSSLAAENTILKENIEKERYRRKHCEDQIHELQNKLLECQEQLAVAHSTEKKKEIMIEQLDMTLANVVDGWKKQENAKLLLINKLKQEKEELELKQQTHEQVLQTFEQDLEQAVIAFKSEQEKLIKTEEESNTRHHNMEERIEALKKQVTELQKDKLLVEDEKSSILKIKEDLVTKNESAIDEYKKRVTELTSTKEKLEEDIYRVEKEKMDSLTDIKKYLEEAQQELEDLRSALNMKEDTLQKQQGQLDSLYKEKETLSMENSLIKSKFDALKTKQDSEMRSKLEEEFNNQIYEIQKQIAKTETELRHSQKKQLSDLSKRHHDELEEQKQRFQTDLKRKDEKIDNYRVDYENKISSAEIKISELSSAGKVLQSQRAELMDRIKGMMQQHWHETVSLLSTGKAPPSPESLNPPVNDQLSSTLRSDITFNRLHNPNIHASNASNYSVPLSRSNDQFEIDRHSQQIYQSSHGLDRPKIYEGSILSDRQQKPIYEKSINVKSNNHQLFPGADERFTPQINDTRVFYGSSSQRYIGVEDRRASRDAFVPTQVNSNNLLNDHLPSQSTSLSSTPRKLAPAQHVRTTVRPQPFSSHFENTFDGSILQNQPDFNQGQNVHGATGRHQTNSQPMFAIERQPHLRLQDFQLQQENHRGHIHPGVNEMNNPSKYGYPQRSDQNYPVPHNAESAHVPFQPVSQSLTYSNNEPTLASNQGNLQTLPNNKENEDPISLLYQDLDGTEVNDDVLMDQSTNQIMEKQEEKQIKLTHFIEKLLQRSPGQPVEGINEKPVANQGFSNNIDQLLKNTPEKQRSSTNPAFKKSVIRGSTDTENRRRHRDSMQCGNLSTSSERISSPDKKRQPLMLDEQQISQLKYLLKIEGDLDEQQILYMLQQKQSSSESHPSKLRSNQQEKLDKFYDAHVRKSTISSEAKQNNTKKAVKPSRQNKNVANKENRRRDLKLNQSKTSSWK